MVSVMGRLVQLACIALAVGLMTATSAAHAQKSGGGPDNANNGGGKDWVKICEQGDGDNDTCVDQKELSTEDNSASPERVCGYYGFDPLVRYNFGGEFELGEGEVTFTPTTPSKTSGSWASGSDNPVSVFAIKQATAIAYWLYTSPPSGVILGNYDSPFGDASNITLCKAKGECDSTPVLENEVVDLQNRQVSNTMFDEEGITEFTFTELTNFTVLEDEFVLPDAQGENFSDKFTKDGDVDQADVKWTLIPGKTAPTRISFTLQAGPDGSATYFVNIVNSCGGDATIDPVYGFTPAGGSAFSFDGPYPNPTRGQAAISFTLPDAAPAKVTIYDVIGRKVATVLKNDLLQPGPHTINWSGQDDNGQRLSSGVYLVRLEAGGRIQTKKITIVN